MEQTCAASRGHRQGKAGGILRLFFDCSHIPGIQAQFKGPDNKMAITKRIPWSD